MEPTSHAADSLDERARDLARVAGRPGDRELIVAVYALEAVEALWEGCGEMAEELLNLAIIAITALRGED